MPKATLTQVDKRIHVTPSRTDGVLSYDVDNAYPQRVENIINSSGTGKLVTKMLAKFIFGGGFTDRKFYEAVVNKKGMTADVLLRKQSREIAKFEGLAFHFNYNLLYKKIEVNFIPFKHVRFTSDENKDHPNMFAVYDDWGKEKKKSIDKERVDYIDMYNPDPEVIKEQVKKAGGWAKYKGQILYWTPEGLEYPLAPGDAVLEDMQTDSHAKIFKYRNITTNFMASHILEVEEFLETDENSTAEDQREAFMETLQNFQGSDEALKILLLEKKPGAGGVNLKKVDIQDVEKLYEYTETSVRDNIIRHYLIPPALLIATAGKLGTAKEINESTQFFNMVTLDYRIVMEQLFKTAFDGFYTELNPTKDFTIIQLSESMREAITSEFFPDTTSNERRASIGLPEKADKEATQQTLAEKIGVGGITAYTAIIANPDLSAEQKLENLQILFGLDKETAYKAVYGREATV